MQKKQTNDFQKKGTTDTSWRDTAGDALEKIGQKISDVGAPTVGQKVHDLGDKLEDSHKDSTHPNKV